MLLKAATVRVEAAWSLDTGHAGTWQWSAMDVVRPRRFHHRIGGRAVHVVVSCYTGE